MGSIGFRGLGFEGGGGVWGIKGSCKQSADNPSESGV